MLFLPFGLGLHSSLANPHTATWYGPKNQYWFLDFWKQPYGWKLTFASWSIFPIALALCKASILTLYHRIFEGTWIRRLLWGSQVFNILLALSYFIANFFIAVPLDCQFYLMTESACLQQNVWDGSGAFSAVNAAFDIWIVAMPAFMIWRLNMARGRRLRIIGIFSTGILYVWPEVFFYAKLVFLRVVSLMRVTIL